MELNLYLSVKVKKNDRELAEIRYCLNMTNYFVACGHQQLQDIDCDPLSDILFKL